MKERRKANSRTTVPFSKTMLAQLKKQGYKYLQIKGHTHDNRIDHIQPHYLILIPFKEFPQDKRDIEIYEPINSDILRSWADSQTGTTVMISYDAT